MEIKSPKSITWIAINWIAFFVLILSLASFFENLSISRLLTKNFANHRPNNTNPGGRGANSNNEVYHDGNIFLEDYKEMKRRLKIYIYPHDQDDPFAKLLSPVEYVPGGNYASELYFAKVLPKSQFVTNNPNEADLFYLPISVSRLRTKRGIGVQGIPFFVRDYVWNVSHKYPYWNRSCGTDHFYVACHSVGQSATILASHVKFNAIQVVCTASYFIYGYVPHKDASMPQIWPRDQEDPPNLLSSKRTRLALFAGAMNCPTRKHLVKVWQNDTEIFVNYGRLKTSYSDELLKSKFFIHVRGFGVNTARIGDAMYYGCVPVIIADHYDLPFSDILNWRSFSVVVAAHDIPRLKTILKGISPDEYKRLRNNVLKVRGHFQWHPDPVDYDAFHMTLYELWLRRSYFRFPSN